MRITTALCFVGVGFHARGVARNQGGCVLHDICSMHYAHPHSWSEIGFGGPANLRGYVRLYFDRRDPWEAAEAKAGHEDEARKENRRIR